MDNSEVNISTMDLEQIQNYQQMLLNNVFTQKLEENEKQTETWTDYKNRHKKVIEGLQVFPLSLSENCMVPIGKLALMKGKLTHTNEVLVCLGDGYFAKYSASQAIALCNRRIAWADEMLKSLEAERNLYEMRQILPLEHDVFGEKDRKDILEHWHENKLDEWRVQHRQREKEYHQKIAKLKEKERTDICTEEDLFKRLDELELEEELEDEMCRLEAEQKGFYSDDLEEDEVYDESEENDTSDSDEITTEMLQAELKKLKDIEMNKITNKLSNVSGSSVTQDESISTNAAKNEQYNSTANSSQEELKKSCLPEPSDVFKDRSTKKKGRVSFGESCIIEDKNISENKFSIFQEVCSTRQNNIYNNKNENSENDSDSIKIEFLHSSHIPNVSESNNMEIHSPTDIYKIFDKPKSILKKSPNDIVPTQIVIPPNEDSSTDPEDNDNVKPSAYNFVIQDIQEKKVISSVDSISEKDKKKIVSRFKKERAGIRK